MDLQEESRSSSELKDVLFGKGEYALFAVLDGAAAKGLVKSLYEFEPEYCCLHRGELPPDRAVVAPYLARLEPETPFVELILNEGWGKHWGIFLQSQASLRTLRDHFRKFLAVELPDHGTVQFRYYDPRGLRAFLPACNPSELAAFFGPVQCFLGEAEAAGSIARYLFSTDKLKTELRQLKAPV